ncbi:uncharacterized protein LOC130749535 [Lotus japonicus]|uniref:uncharacterized protein LOC130749535 n=1 Tax=Lotus japonicus TaxID=34305 RepID=UPI002582F53B|nr:uncharacterized protein LOC130749535 [Lotus japonicus]
MMFQQSSFCSNPLSQTTFFFGHPLLHHHQQLSLHSPRRAKPSTFRVSSLGAGFFDNIAQIGNNKVLVAASTSMAIGQLSKPFASVFLYGKEFDVKSLIQAGGFPSSHSSATVAAATILGLERGFSDPIFGLSVVYAGLTMYDAQGVRREVGIHARTLNKLLLKMHVNSSLSKDREGLINSQPGLSKPPKVEGIEKSILSKEVPQQGNARLLVSSGSKIRQTDTELLSSGLSADAEEISKLVADGLLPLKEAVGHTEVEVIAGALLGVLVGLGVYNFI